MIKGIIKRIAILILVFLVAYTAHVVSLKNEPADERSPAAIARPRRLLATAFVVVKGDHFEIGGERYSYFGTNLWAAMNLGSTGPGGDRARLVRELDRLKALGVLNLRIVAASEGPGTEPGRIVPALQNTPGVFDPNLLDGLDFALSEMSKRGMRAVLILNNFWAWSGGMAQYVSWANGSKIPYPSPFGNSSWTTYELYASQFYSNTKAIALANTAIQTIVTRTNSFTGVAYNEDPTIMAWELGNEPRGMLNKKDFNTWIATTARYIKSLDPHHLVTTGTEGSLNGAGIDIAQNNSSPDIDYATTHIWVQNFGWYDPQNPSTYSSAVQKMKDYLDSQISANSLDPKSPVTLRDQFYQTILAQAYSKAQNHQSVCGVNFWAWSGEAVPPGRPNGLWQVGDPWLGDPPHEAQGWYSIYTTDASTLSIIQNFTKQFSALTN
jgi:mannan endo-1,4-beta-mannosidase